VSSGPTTYDATLAALFETELETTLAALAQGIVQLEEHDRDPAQLERVMRATHSIKGAASIVGIDAAVRLAHALEDFFTWALRSDEAVAKEAIDVVLQGVDALTSLQVACRGDLAEWVAREAEACTLLAGRISALAGGGVPPRPPPSTPSTLAAKAAVPAESAPVPTAAPAPAAERVLRLTAQNVDRLIGLTGESLVEARRVGGFVANLSRLKRRLSSLSDRLREVERLAGASADRAVADAASASRSHLEEDRRVLFEEIESIENYARRVDDLGGRAYRETLKSKLRPFREAVVGLPRMVRDLAHKLGKEAKLEVLGEATLVDRDVLETLESCLIHLLRNALDHGLELPSERTARGKAARGSLSIEARHHAGMLAISVSDDGRGIDPEAIRARVVEKGLAHAALAASLSLPEVMEFLFLPGFSTANSVTEISGRGVGLDAVRSSAEAAGGSVRVTSEVGRGAAFDLRLPVTRSVILSLLVEIAGERFAFPLTRISEILRVPRAAVTPQEGRELCMHRGQSLALVRGAQLLGFEDAAPPGEDLCIVVSTERGAAVGVVVDRFLGQQELAVHPLDPRIGRVQEVSATAILVDGSPVLILDVDGLFRSIDRLLGEHALTTARPAEAPGEKRPVRRVLVVEDSIIVREAERQILENAGYAVETAVDGVDGWNLLRAGHFDLVVTDVDMPGMSGIELLRSIRAEERLRSIPVVIVSYKDRPEDKLRGLEAGATSYLTKTSFHDRTFIDAIEDLIGTGVS